MPNESTGPNLKAFVTTRSDNYGSSVEIKLDGMIFATGYIPNQSNVGTFDFSYLPQADPTNSSVKLISSTLASVAAMQRSGQADAVVLPI